MNSLIVGFKKLKYFSLSQNIKNQTFNLKPDSTLLLCQPVLNLAVVYAIKLVTTVVLVHGKCKTQVVKLLKKKSRFECCL